MFENLLQNVESYIHINPWLAFVAVFVGGALTASNPCVLAMIPLMMSFVAGRQEEQLGPLRAFCYSLLFVVGLAITFTALGVIAAVAGTLYGDVSNIWNWMVAAVCLVMGLHLAGALKFAIPMPLSLQPQTKGALGALVMGLLFGVVSTPCAAPILIVLLTYLAGAQASVAYGALLLLTYSLGHSLLILVAGTSMGLARKLLESRRLTRTTEIMRRLAGVAIVMIGIFFGYRALAA
ncbi:cytochrome c biogenesis CcdA family protein [Planctomycetota bacterium]